MLLLLKLPRMFKLLLVLLIMRFDVLIATKSSGEPSKDPRNNILPLVLIITKENEFIHPTRLLLTIKDDDGNFLSGTIFVAERDGKQSFFCGRAPSEENAKMEIDGEHSNANDRYCLNELPEFEQGTRYLQCAHEPEPFVQKLTEKKNSNKEEEIPCKTLYNEPGVMFAFVYKVKINDDKAHLFEVYRFCYNDKTKEVLFTEHTIAAPRFLDPYKDSFARERSQTYEMSDEPYDYFDTKYQTIKNAYQDIKDQKESLSGRKRSREAQKWFITNKFQLSDQKLVPSDDMVFALWRKTTYHFLNVKPMEKEKIKLWDHINQLIRDDAFKKSREYHILTGAFNITSDGKDKQELIQSPDLWLKVVHHTWQGNNQKHNESIAIIMNHNPEIEYVDRYIMGVCPQNLCKNSFDERFPAIGNFVCCTSTANIKHHFHIKVDDHMLLKIDSFIRVTEEATTSSTNQKKFSLPLVLIRTEDGKFIHPTDIQEPVTDNKGNMLFGTRFSADEEGKQLFFCGRVPSEKNTKMLIDGDSATSDDQYCSYELSQPESQSTSIAVRKKYLQCAHTPKPFVLKLTERDGENEEKEVYCGSVFNQKSRMYAFVYKIKTKDDEETSIFEVYRFCYDEIKHKVLFTEHTIRSPKLLNLENLRQERTQTYEMSDEGYQYFGTTYETIKKAYIEFQDEKEKQKWSGGIIKDSIITPKFLLSDQKLVPPDDMAFASWRKTTYHCLNAQLMQNDKIDLWDHISELIRKDAIAKSREYVVHTRAFDVTNEGKDENENIQSPDFWMKIVCYKNEKENQTQNEAIAIVMMHNPKIDLVANTYNHICEENVCQLFAGASVCCTTSMTKVDFYFDLKLDDHVPLEIGWLYTKKEDGPEGMQEEMHPETQGETNL